MECVIPPMGFFALHRALLLVQHTIPVPSGARLHKYRLAVLDGLWPAFRRIMAGLLVPVYPPLPSCPARLGSGGAFSLRSPCPCPCLSQQVDVMYSAPGGLAAGAQLYQIYMSGTASGNMEPSNTIPTTGIEAQVRALWLGVAAMRAGGCVGS